MFCQVQVMDVLCHLFMPDWQNVSYFAAQTIKGNLTNGNILIYISY